MKNSVYGTQIVNYGTQIVSIVRTLKKDYQLRCVATIEFQEIAILLKQRVYNNQKNHDFIQIIPDIYLTVFAKTCPQLTLRQSQWPGVF